MVHPAGTVQLYEVAPVTAVILYVKVPPPQRFVLVPEMFPGWEVTERTVRLVAVLFPQLVPALTVTLPEVYPEGNVTEIEVVPCPLLITAPLGTVQL